MGVVLLSSGCRHPLFPLLALLFEKCEQSTQSSDCITSASFDVDIENFVRSQEKEGKAFFSEDPDLDNLVRGQGPGVGPRVGFLYRGVPATPVSLAPRRCCLVLNVRVSLFSLHCSY